MTAPSQPPPPQQAASAAPSDVAASRAAVLAGRAGPRRRGASLADMARSLGLMAVVVGVTLIFVPGLLSPSKSQRMAPVDDTSYFAGFGQETGVAALAPSPPPLGFRANAGSLTGRPTAAHLHIGFAVYGALYAELEESVAPSAGFLASVLGKHVDGAAGEQTIDGRVWGVRPSSRGEDALTHRFGRVTVVVTGSATPGELDSLAASLKPSAARG